jgi:hypothetical protein
MSEYDIAVNDVRPYLNKVLGFPEENIKGSESHPGTDTLS